MPFVDPDNFNPPVVDELISMYEQTAENLRKIVLAPPGGADSARAFNQSDAAQRLGLVQQEITRLKQKAGKLTGKAIDQAMNHGSLTAQRQIADLGPITPGKVSSLDTGPIQVLARDTIGDLVKGADSLGNTAQTLLRRMAATGVTNQQVNQIVAGGILEGDTRKAAQRLGTELKAVHGEKIIIQGKNGPIEYDTDYYAGLVMRTKTREAVVLARHGTLQARGFDLVKIIGRISKNFCTNYLGKVYSLSGESKKYPALSSLPNGGPPFHPQCSKSTTPFIEALASKPAAAATDATPAVHGPAAAAQERSRAIAEDIRARARKAGYEPPPHGFAK